MEGNGVGNGVVFILVMPEGLLVSERVIADITEHARVCRFHGSLQKQVFSK